MPESLPTPETSIQQIERAQSSAIGTLQGNADAASAAD
jgi:hypothetical protein